MEPPRLSGQPGCKHVSQIAQTPLRAGRVSRFLKEAQPEPQLALVFFVVHCEPHALGTSHVAVHGKPQMRW